MRADAQRNRERILAAARELVAETGVDATMENIAQRAGVAVGTLYRHFPAKEDLVDAVVDDSIEYMATLSAAALAAVEAGASGADELASLFRVVAERHVTDQALKAAAGRLDLRAELAAAGPDTPVGRAIAAITSLLERATAAGAIRADVTVADLALMLGALPGADVPIEMRRRFVEIMIAGLTTPANPRAAAD